MEKSMHQANSKKETTPPTQVRLVVEVDGNPVGFVSLDLDRIWPLINHRKGDAVPVEWMDPSKYDSVMRASVLKRMISRIEGRLYQTLGDEMVKAELDVESFTLKAESAAQAFGHSKADIEKLVGDSGRSPAEFYNFLWEFLLHDREISDLKKEWKAKDTPLR